MFGLSQGQRAVPLPRVASDLSGNPARRVAVASCGAGAGDGAVVRFATGDTLAGRSPAPTPQPLGGGVRSSPAAVAAAALVPAARVQVVNGMAQGPSRQFAATPTSFVTATPMSLTPRGSWPCSPGRAAAAAAAVHAAQGRPVPTSTPPALSPPLQHSPDGAGLRKVTELLSNRNELKREVTKSFWACGKSQNLNINGLLDFRTNLLASIGVPDKVFGDLEAEYIRFDFDGGGTLTLNEVYKLVKFHLREYQKRFGGVDPVSVPTRSLEEAGYRITRELGKGSQGTAKLAQNVLTGQEVCLKCYRKDRMTAGGVEELKDEFDCMQLLACQRIAQCFEIFQDDSFFYLTGEAYCGGDFTMLKTRAHAQGVSMTEDWWRNLYRQCFEALEFMHSNAMMHCDVKEPNMMIKTGDFRSPQVVFIDFGVSKVMVGEHGLASGTPGYVPPETIATKKWFPNGDIFSIGVCIMQIMCDKVPPQGRRTLNAPGGIFVEGCRNAKEIYAATQTRQPPFHLMPKEFPVLTQLVMRLLEKQMNARPRAPMVLQDPWFTGVLRDPREPHPSTDNLQEDGRLLPRHPFLTCGLPSSFLMAVDQADEPEDLERALDEHLGPSPPSGGPGGGGGATGSGAAAAAAARVAMPGPAVARGGGGVGVREARLLEGHHGEQSATPRGGGTAAAPQAGAKRLSIPVRPAPEAGAKNLSSPVCPAPEAPMAVADSTSVAGRLDSDVKERGDHIAQQLTDICGKVQSSVAESFGKVQVERDRLWTKLGQLERDVQAPLVGMVRTTDPTGAVPQAPHRVAAQRPPPTVVHPLDPSRVRCAAGSQPQLAGRTHATAGSPTNSGFDWAGCRMPEKVLGGVLGAPRAVPRRSA